MTYQPQRWWPYPRPRHQPSFGKALAWVVVGLLAFVVLPFVVVVAVSKVPTSDQRFLAYLTTHGVTAQSLADQANREGAGHLACGLLSARFEDKPDVERQVVDRHGFGPSEAHVIVEAAVTVYCPEYAQK